MGSTRIARRAGMTDAVTPARASTAHPPANVSGSVAVTPNSCDSMYRVPMRATASPMATPMASRRSPCPKKQRDDRGGLRAHGETNPDLRRSLAGGVRHHAIEATHRKQQRDGAEEADEDGHRSLPAQGSIEHITEQLGPLDGDLAIDLPHGIANRRHE